MLSISTYTIWGGVEVIEGELELPLYVTNIGVFNAAGAAATAPCLVKIVFMWLKSSFTWFYKS